MNIEIQTPGIEDLPQIVEIFNQAIRNRFSTGFQDEFEVEDMHGWFLEHSIKNYPILVAKENDKVIGWASIKPYRKDREAFSKTMEVNYFVHNDFHRKGVGGMLLGEIQKNAANLGYKTLIAILMHVNIGSIKLLEKQKFHLWGKLPKVGYIDGIEVDHLFYGKHLTES
jgi:phosphinothricin acetyltransferase